MAEPPSPVASLTVNVIERIDQTVVYLGSVMNTPLGSTSIDAANAYLPHKIPVQFVLGLLRRSIDGLRSDKFTGELTFSAIWWCDADRARRRDHRYRRSAEPDDALSETKRSAANQWFASTLLSRLDDKRTGAIVVVMQRVHVVADRGMISAATIAGLEERKLEYILGARERSDVVVRRIVLKNDDPFVPLLVERKTGETQLFVKQVKVEGARYVVCRNEEEAENDRKEREAIVAALDAQLKKGDKALIGNSAYPRYLRKVGAKGAHSFEIDAGKLAEEVRFDGIFVLRTNAKVTPLRAVLRYRDLLQVEDLFRRTKAIMRTRPIFHSSDAAIRGHVFCSFLALAMQKHLDDLLRLAGLAPEWKDLLRDLDRLAQVRIRLRGAAWLVRTDAAPAVTTLFKSAHIAVPPRARQARPPPPPPTKPARKRRGRPRRSATPT